VHFKKRLSLSLLTLIISEIINKLTPLIILRLARIRLGLDIFGKAQYAIIFIETIAPFLTIGSSLLGALELGDGRLKNNREKKIFSFHLILAKSLMLIVTLLILIPTILKTSLYEYKTYLFAASLLLLSTVLETDYISLGKQRLILRHIFISFSKIFGLFLMIFFVHGQDDVLKFIVFYCLPLLSLACLSFVSNIKD
jgi:hypothetical protein